MQVVLADGRVIEVGSRARKASNGYDLKSLLIGSEGTLGIITRIRLKLHGIPEATSAAVCQFPTLKAAVDTVIATLQMGVPVARIELLDEVQMAACIAYSKLEGMTPTPALFLEFHGTEAGVREQAETVGRSPPTPVAWASPGPRMRRRATGLWKARHDAYWAAIASRPGSRGIATDVCLPISHLAAALLGAKEDIAASGFSAPMVGHVGDGNFHTVILLEDDRPETLEAAWALDKKIVSRALALGGTCSASTASAWASANSSKPSMGRRRWRSCAA